MERRSLAIPTSSDLVDTPRENPTDPPGPSIFAALAKLGLRLEPGKGTEEVIVIDQVDRASSN